jgi:hypothetical protein
MANRELLDGWISHFDSKGPKVHLLVAEAAHAVLPAAVWYSQGNSTEAAEILAKTAFVVSKFVYRNGPPARDKQGREIQDMKDYLYRAYMKNANHRFRRKPKNHAVLVSLDLTREPSDGGSSKRGLENEALVEKLLSQMDPKLKAIFFWREIEGCRWKQVGKIVGMKPHAAKMYYLRGIDRLARLVLEGSKVVSLNETRDKGKASGEN